MLGITFPPINELIRWTDFAGNFNKIALLACAAAVIVIVIFT